MISRVDVSTFVKLAENALILDVRSPAEYTHARIPGAISFPLFSDDERKVVGTAYKQESREQAIKIGLDYFGPKMRKMVEQVEDLLAGEDKEVLVYCWRGGMRSGGVAWLLDLYGFRVTVLEGGYKAFRNWVLKTIASPYKLQVLGGYTGSGKTEILKKLQDRGGQVIDLEALANHKGSALGGIGQPAQPSQEMFENLLASALSKLDSRNIIWVEDESQRIGDRNIPNEFMDQIRSSKVIFLDVPFEKRLDYLVIEYGQLPIEKIINSIIRIKKRLGGLETKNAINHLLEGETRESFEILLRYYDKFYGRALNERSDVTQRIKLEAVDCGTNGEVLLKLVS